MSSRKRSRLQVKDDPQSSSWTLVRKHANSCILISLAALAHCVSLLHLSPVYGSIPASSYHDSLPVAAVVLAGIASALELTAAKHVLELALPMHAATVPALQHYVLMPASSTLGSLYGPLVTEVVTVVPSLVMTLALVQVDCDDFFHGRPKTIQRGVVPVLVFAILTTAEKAFNSLLLPYVGITPWLTRWTLELVVASAYVLLYPSKLLFLSLIPALSFLLQTSPHGYLPGNIRRLNRNLAHQGYTLLERRESVSGYLSVLQNEHDQFRVMRCDHSLLGGVWLPTEARKADGVTTSEPVFPVFTMLESVRLMQSVAETIETSTPLQKALVIGLGIGTCPAALAAHGVNTTTLELDPGVTALARTHFGFDATAPVIHGDAVSTTSKLAAAGETYDFIVHDVFTGGAEPVALFTQEFLETLRALLTPQGSIAVNYAGDLHQPTTTLVLDTITSTFPNCKVYRDEPAKHGAAHGRTRGSDFANFVAFCKAGDWAFREPVEPDFLQSQARRRWMVPSHRVAMDALPREVGQPAVLTVANAGVLERTHRRSAAEHWRIMRGLLPDAVWLNW